MWRIKWAFWVLLKIIIGKLSGDIILNSGIKYPCEYMWIYIYQHAFERCGMLVLGFVSSSSEIMEWSWWIQAVI